MSNRRRVVERNAGAFLGPDLLAAAPMNALYVGPGQPGAGDDWRMPTDHPDETAAQDDVIVEPVQSAHTVLLPSTRTRKRQGRPKA